MTFWLFEDPGAQPAVRRKIVIWKRLEPGDLRSASSLPTPESPYIEARVVEIGLPKARHDEMTRLAAIKDAATRLPSRWFLHYEPTGVILAFGASLMIGAGLDFLPGGRLLFVLGAIIAAIAVVIGFFSRGRYRAALAEAEARWKTTPEKEEYEQLAREVAAEWIRVSQAIKSATSFHTEIRVAEGSADPLRLAAIDPRPLAGGRGFDPEDFLPTIGGGVRYESVHSVGEAATRIFPGTTEVDEVLSPSREADSPAPDTNGSSPESP